MTRIAIIDGHPDPHHDCYVHALADAYAEGAAEAHEIKIISVSTLAFPTLRSRADWEHAEPPPSIRDAQDVIAWAEHLVFLYPLWLGEVPALLKAFLEQVFRPDFAFRYVEKGMPVKRLKGRSARLIVTMGMPRLFYRLFYRAHSVKSFERNILAFVGIGPVRHTIVGSVEKGAAHRRRWLERVRELGRSAR